MLKVHFYYFLGFFFSVFYSLENEGLNFKGLKKC